VLNPELFERPEFLAKWADAIGSDEPKGPAAHLATPKARMEHEQHA
jgi:hypothetical protein